MAESEDGQEKTEEPTAKRLEKAREDGQIPRSRELTTTLVLITASVALYVFGQAMADALGRIFRASFTVSRDALFDPWRMLLKLGAAAEAALTMAIPLLAVLLLMALIGPLGLGGWSFSGKAALPKWSRMNPLSGLKRMFSVQALIELGKGLAKVAVIGVAAFAVWQWCYADVLLLSRVPLEIGLPAALKIVAITAVVLSVSTVLIALVDAPIQWYQHQQKLKMTMQEIKDEMKETDGRPEVKGRIRQVQREMASRRMMAAVPDADVIITNPTHFAVALKYDPDAMASPKLLAKGVDEQALKIREIASAHRIEQVESPPLARSIYHTTEVDDDIPEQLYLAVAHVLAYVFQIQAYRKHRQGEKPTLSRKLPIPDDVRYDP